MRKKMYRCAAAVVMIIYIGMFGVLQAPTVYAASGGNASVVIEAETGRVLFASNPNLELPMASTTKIMTALVALEHGELDAPVEIPDEAVGVEGSSIYLKHGETLTLEELLYGLMLSSGNDAAVAIACHIGGSVQGFVDMMNQKAGQLGAENTHFMNPNGLQDESHYTSARDLANITAAAMQHPTFRKICSTQYKEISGPDGGKRTLKNKNKILWQYEGGNGVKTGYTKAAGKCLVSSAKREDMQLICVVLNSSNMFGESMELLNQSFNDFDYASVLSQGEPLGVIPVRGSELKEVSITMDTDIRLPLTQEEQNAVDIKVSLVPLLQAPVSAGSKVGQLELFVSDVKVLDMDILLHQDILEKSWGSWLGDILKEWQFLGH